MSCSNRELTKFSDLIRLIYEAATDPGQWNREILPALAAYIQAPECFLFTPLQTPQNGGYMYFHGIAREHADLYFNKYHHEDLWTMSALQKNLLIQGNVIFGDELMPREQWLASQTYIECFARDENMAQLMTSVVFGLDTAGSLVTCCSFFRGLHHPKFDENDRARLRLILPHLSRSLAVMQRLQLAELTEATSLAALDRMPSGILLLDESGAVAFSNRSAQRMLANGDGLRINNQRNKTGLGNLVAENPEAASAISAAISATANTDPNSTPHISKCVTVPRPSGMASYTMQFSALGKQNEFGSTSGKYSTISLIADGARDTEINPEMLQSAYGLTPTEAKVAVTLLKSNSAQEVANKLGTSPHTVNTQIKHIYCKLGVDTRTRFVKLMLGIASHS